MVNGTAQRTCQRCGTTFTRKPSGPEPRYCGETCKRAQKQQLERERGQYDALLASRKARTAAARPQCINCGQPAANSRARYCMAEACRALYRQERQARNTTYWRENYADVYAKATVRRLNPDRAYTCSICGQEFPRSKDWKRTRYCSMPCVRVKEARDRKDQAKRKGRQAFRSIPLSSLERWAECQHCGETFRKDHPSQILCDRFCRAGAATCRRSKRAVAAWVERVERIEVFERDGWLCHLCGGALQRGARVPERLAPTIDHIVPLTRGGEHSMANVAAAHFSCNSRKGNRVAA